MSWVFFIVMFTMTFLSSVGMGTLILPLLNHGWQNKIITKRTAGGIWFCTIALSDLLMILYLLVVH